MKLHQETERNIKILELAAKNLTQDEIAKQLDISQPNVNHVLKKFKPVFKALERVDEYRAVKSNILAAGQLAALESAFSGKKLEKASFVSTLTGFEILNKAERLDTGQSTENIKHSVFGKLAISDETKDTQPIDITPLPTLRE